jgi:hypothetical protein
MRKISVQLDEIVSQKLDETIKINRCSISDVVNAAILAFAQDKQPVILKPSTPTSEMFEVIGDVDAWCNKYAITKSRLRYLIERTAKGHNVCGFGNSKNKWRDKLDGRVFKTHTAWIAHCLKEDFGIDL